MKKNGGIEEEPNNKKKMYKQKTKRIKRTSKRTERKKRKRKEKKKILRNPESQEEWEAEGERVRNNTGGMTLCKALMGDL